MERRKEGRKTAVLSCCCIFLILMAYAVNDGEAVPMRAPTSFRAEHKNAYATMMYMGTPRDYEFYVATRVMLTSLRKLGVDADLVVIASLDVPDRWVQTLIYVVARILHSLDKRFYDIGTLWKRIT